MAEVDRFLAAAETMADKVRRSGPRRWFIDCDTDADGLCAAAVMTVTLRRLGHRVHVRPSRDKHAAHYEALSEAPGDALLLLDKGSSHIDRLPAGRPVFVVDHHNVVQPVPAREVHVLNPRLEGLDGSRDASASTAAAALAWTLLGHDALPWAAVALAGAVGDWQHRPTWAGWNLRLLGLARDAGHVETRNKPRLIGVDLADAALSHGLPPHVLDAMGVDGKQESAELDRETATRLVSALAFSALARGEPARTVRRLVSDEDHDVRLGASLRTVFRVTDACGRLGHPATGLAYLLGDAAATAEAHGHFAAYRGMLRSALEAFPGDLQEARHVRWAWTADPALTGMVAGIVLESGRIDTSQPLCVFAHRPDGRIQVSTRALAAHVAQGLDLGACTAEAAEAVQAEGGGHPVAAGAVLPAGTAAGFLAALDRAVGSPGKAVTQT